MGVIINQSLNWNDHILLSRKCQKVLVSSKILERTYPRMFY